MQIREMQKADIAEVARIAQAIMPFAWSELTFSNSMGTHYHAAVLEENQKIIGFVISRILLPECEIMNIGVRADYQHQGYGELLLQHVIQKAQQENVKKIWLEVRVSNEAALALYQKYLFKKIHVRKDYYSREKQREDAVILARIIE